MRRDYRGRFRDGSPRAGSQLLHARVLGPAAAVSGRRQRRLSRGDWGCRGAVHHPLLLEADRAAEGRATAGWRSRIPDEDGAGQGRVSALRPPDRSVALGRVLGSDSRQRIQRGMVGPQAEVPGRGAARPTLGDRFRSGREISRSGEHSVFTILSRRHPAVPVSPSALPGSGVLGAPARLLGLWEQAGWHQTLEHDEDGNQQAVARGIDGADRAKNSWTRPPSWTTLRRSRRGSTSRTPRTASSPGGPEWRSKIHGSRTATGRQL